MSVGYFGLLIVTWCLSQVLSSEYDEGKPWNFVISTIQKTGWNRRDKTGQTQNFLESGLWHIDPADVGQKTMTSEKSGVEF